MFKAKDNIGLYYELKLLLEYIEDYEDLNLLNELINDFNKKGLTSFDIKIVVELIEEYLPKYITCDCKGCYLYQIIDGIETYTNFTNLDTEVYFTNQKVLYSIQ